MSPILRNIKPKDVVRVITKLGFEFDRQSGSRAIYYCKSDQKRIVIPVHAGRTLKPKALSGIIKDIGLTVDEFKTLP